MGKREARPPRRYDASGRRRRAEENRERALDAARSLFAERGYAETTIDAIAVAAGVAAPTLYAMFRSKRGVLSALLRRLVSGEAGSPPLLDTAGPRAVMAETDPRRLLALFATSLNSLLERVGPTYEVMRNAAHAESDAAELLREMQAYRYANQATIAARLSDLAALRPGLSVEDAARTVWALASPEIRQALLVFAGWSAERYTAWLSNTLAAALLSPKSDPGEIGMD
jgi:AcrR family transcriptional regulator